MAFKTLITIAVVINAFYFYFERTPCALPAFIRSCVVKIKFCPIFRNLEVCSILNPIANLPHWTQLIYLHCHCLRKQTRTKAFWKSEGQQMLHNANSLEWSPGTWSRGRVSAWSKTNWLRYMYRLKQRPAKMLHSE